MCLSGISFDVAGVLFWVPAAPGYLLLQERNSESSCADTFRLSSEVCLNWPFLYQIFKVYLFQEFLPHTVCVLTYRQMDKSRLSWATEPVTIVWGLGTGRKFHYFCSPLSGLWDVIMKPSELCFQNCPFSSLSADTNLCFFQIIQYLANSVCDFRL